LLSHWQQWLTFLALGVKKVNFNKIIKEVVMETKRVCVQEVKFFRGREASLLARGIKLEIFHVLRKAKYKLNQVILFNKEPCIVKEVSIKEKYTYYRLQTCKGVNLSWKYEQDIQAITNQSDLLGR
jgi:hypothetical protein